MQENKLKMNNEKTYLLLVASKRKLKEARKELSDGLVVLGMSVPFWQCVRNLGVFMDGPLSMESHIKRT